MKIKREYTYIIVLLALACLGFLVWRQVTFRVVGTNPHTNKVSTVAPFFKVHFNKSLSKTGLSVQTSPVGFVGKASVDGNQINIPITKILEAGRIYTISLKNIQSISGKTIANKVFTFTPQYIPSSQLPKDQQQAILRHESTGSINTSDPILKHLPYKTTDFSLSLSGVPPKEKLAKLPLLAVINLSQADMGNESLATTQYKQEVISYITSLGLNPGDYDITYTVQAQ